MLASRVCRAEEAEGQGGSRAVSVADAAEHAPAEADLSLGDFPHPVDLHGIRRRLPEQWAGFLRAHFQNAAHIAAFFDVDHKTARDWLHGKHGVNGAPLLMLIRENPVARQFFLGDAA